MAPATEGTRFSLSVNSLPPIPITVIAGSPLTLTVSPIVDTTPPLPAGWTQTVFYDDFSGGLSKWRVRDNDTSNNELSRRFARNVSVSGGVLAITAKLESTGTGTSLREYTSGYLDTIGKPTWQYGRWECRAKAPAARGTWPAFWLRENTGVGEIDIVESVGGKAQAVQTVHQSTNGDLAKAGHAEPVDPTAWHTYAVEREPGVIRWLIDDRVTFMRTSDDLTWLGTVLDEPVNIRLNLQVGGSMPNYFGLAVDKSALPADLLVDYVRVLQR